MISSSTPSHLCGHSSWMATALGSSMDRPPPLARPIWSSLTTRQAHLALGDARALRFAPEYGVFGAAADGSSDSLKALAALIPAQGAIALTETSPDTPLPAGVNVIRRALIDQMVAEALTPAPEPAFAITALTDADGPEMLALAT